MGDTGGAGSGPGGGSGTGPGRIMTLLGRVSAGRLNGIHADPGTILGPKSVTREFVVVTGNDDHGVTVGYARTDDLDFPAIERMAVNPGSVTEAQMVMGYQVTDRLRLRDLFGGAA